MGDRDYVYVCPICGYVNHHRLNAAKHLVDGHMMVATVEEAEAAGGVQYDHWANIWKENPDPDALADA